MLKVNEYFDGRVKSLGFDRKGGQATVGVMEAGTYEFSTGKPELMKVLDGSMEVLLPGETNWAVQSAGTEFKVGGNSRFQVRCDGASAYLCIFL